MPISVTCPECGYGFSVRDQYVGRRGKCPQCGGVFVAEANVGGDFPAIVTDRPAPRNGASHPGNGASGRAALGDLAVKAPVVNGMATTSVASAYAARQRSSGLPGWGWVAIGVMLLVTGGAIGGAWALAPDPIEVRKIVKDRTAKADKAVESFKNEVYDKIDDVDAKVPGLEDGIEEFARPKTIDEDVIPGVVKVLNVQGGGPRGSGTGWIINDKHWIATNHHVVDGCDSLYVETADGKKHDIEGIIADKQEWDLAILKPKEKIPGGKPLRIAPNDGSYLPNAGDEVWAIGNPATHIFTATHGVITRRLTQRQLINEASQTDTAFYADPERDIMWIEHDARIFPGNSGGPLLDENFRVIGVNTLLQMVPLQRAIENAKKEKHGLRMSPTFGLASNSMYILELEKLHKDGNLQKTF